MVIAYQYVYIHKWVDNLAITVGSFQTARETGGRTP